MTKAVIIHGNQSIYSHKQMKETIKQTLADKAWARWTALILIASMMFFAYMFVDVMARTSARMEFNRLRHIPFIGIYPQRMRLSDHSGLHS